MQVSGINIIKYLELQINSKELNHIKKIIMIGEEHTSMKGICNINKKNNENNKDIKDYIRSFYVKTNKNVRYLIEAPYQCSDQTRENCKNKNSIDYLIPYTSTSKLADLVIKTFMNQENPFKWIGLDLRILNIEIPISKEQLSLNFCYYLNIKFKYTTKKQFYNTLNHIKKDIKQSSILKKGFVDLYTILFYPEQFINECLIGSTHEDIKSLFCKLYQNCIVKEKVKQVCIKLVQWDSLQYTNKEKTSDLLDYKVVYIVMKHFCKFLLKFLITDKIEDYIYYKYIKRVCVSLFNYIGILLNDCYTILQIYQKSSIDQLDIIYTGNMHTNHLIHYLKQTGWIDQEKDKKINDKCVQIESI